MVLVNGVFFFFVFNAFAHLNEFFLITPQKKKKKKHPKILDFMMFAKSLVIKLWPKMDYVDWFD